jgi:predicted Zn-dependent protease
LIQAAAVLALFCVAAHAQPSPKAETSVSVQQAIEFVKTGRCAAALPALRRGVPQLEDKQLRYHGEMAMVRCAMALDDEQVAVETLLRLRRDAPDDPEALYIATHYFSELGMRASQQLAAKAPNSFQARKLEAEALESQGKTPGIHYRLGQIALDAAGAAGSTDAARREFEQEIAVDPLNASAHFILGELARRSNDFDVAVKEFSQAAKLDVGFSEAYLALGMSLAGSGKFADAIAPLERYVKMEPGDPAGHYQLATAYSRTGDKAGATRELALQTQAANSHQATDSAEGHSVQH